MTADTSPGSKRRSKANWFWLAAWLATLVAVVALVFKVRDTTFAQMDTPEARAQWDAWRAAPPNQSSSGPVDRKPPRATEPPALLLMRDHFAVVMSGSLLFSSLLFAALMLAFRGAFSSTPLPSRERDSSR